MERDAKLVTVRDFMRTEVFSLKPATPILEAMATLRRHGMRAAPVLDAEGRPVGMFSETDCLRVLASAAWHEMPIGTVHDHMTHLVVGLSPDIDVFRAARRFSSAGLRMMPVVEGGRVIGVVTAGDLARALWQIQQQREAGPVKRKPEGAAYDPEESRARDRRALGP